MITHGNKQISEIVYARKASEGGGAVRLTNIIRGAQVVFGGLYPKVTWPYPPTRAAILAAFGQTDGKAVIKATNAYLNALAATDPTKASALAGLINEDPMLVCSLVETSKERWLVGDGNSWIDCGFKPDADTTYGATILPQFDTNNNKSIFGARDEGGTPTFLLQSINKQLRTETFGSWKEYGSILQDVVENVEFSYKGMWQDGVEIATGNYNPTKAWSLNMYIYAHNVKGSAGPKDYCFVGGFSEFYCKDENGNRTRQFYPFIHDDNGTKKNGMLDILTGTFYENKGTGQFTIQITDKA